MYFRFRSKKRERCRVNANTAGRDAASPAGVVILRTVLSLMTIFLALFLTLHAVVVAFDRRSHVQYPIEVINVTQLVLFDAFVAVINTFFTVFD